MSSSTRLRYPRRAKRVIDYLTFNKTGRMPSPNPEKKQEEDASVNKPEMEEQAEETKLAAAEGGDDAQMSQKEFREFKQRLAEFIDESEDDEGTDEETQALLDMLKEVRKKKKAIQVQKRKHQLHSEIEKQLAELKELKQAEQGHKEEVRRKQTEEMKGAKTKRQKEGKKKEAGKEKGKGKSSTDKEKGEFLDINTLRNNKSVMKKVDKQMKKMLRDLSPTSESETDSDCSSSEETDYESDSTSFESDSSDENYKKGRRHKKHKKHKKVRSGIKDRPHDKVKMKMNWPQSELKYEFTNRKPVEFKQLSLNQFCAGELEIIRNCKISKVERTGRLALLNKICYYASEFEWPVLLNFYAAWVKLIEKGENSWSDDTTLLEVRMLIGKKGKNFVKNQQGQVNEKEKERTWYCPLFQRNRCTHKEDHKMEINGRSRFVQHLCATCLRKDGNKLKHPESSSACPNML